MFVTLLVVTFVLAAIVAVLVARWFAEPIQRILKQIVGPDVSYAWGRYLHFAILVVGISSGVHVYQLERYITALLGSPEERQVLQLTQDRWVLELYRTVIGTLQGIAWVLLVFFVVALLAFVIVRLAEARRKA